MRDVSHDRDTELPPPMPRPAPMSKDDVWTAVEWQTRLLGEAYRRGLPADLIGRLDVARSIGLGMFSTASESPEPRAGAR